MAEQKSQQEKDLEAAEKAFKEAERAPLSAISHVGEDQILSEAKDVGIISKGVEQKIIGEIGHDHADLYRKNVAKLEESGLSRPEALEEAFGRTYGKFRLEQDHELKKSDNEFIKMLGVVAKYKPGEEGIGRRNELEVAAAYLNNLLWATKAADEHVDGEIEERENRKKGVEAEVKKLEGRKKALDEVNAVVNEADVTKGLNDAATNFGVAVTATDESDGIEDAYRDGLATLRRQLIETDQGIIGYVERASKVRGILVELRYLIEENVKDHENDLRQINEIIEEFDSINIGTEFNHQKFKSFLDERVTPYLNEFYPERHRETKTVPVTVKPEYALSNILAQFEALANDKAFFSDNYHIFNDRDEISSNISKTEAESIAEGQIRKENYQIALNKWAEISEFLGKAADGAERLQGLHIPGLTDVHGAPSIPDECRAFIEEYEGFVEKHGLDITGDQTEEAQMGKDSLKDLERFIKHDYEPFIEALREAFAQLTANNKVELNSVQSKITRLDKEISDRMRFPHSGVYSKLEKETDEDKSRIKAELKNLKQNLDAAKAEIKRLETEAQGVIKEESEKRNEKKEESKKLDASLKELKEKKKHLEGELEWIMNSSGGIEKNLNERKSALAGAKEIFGGFSPEDEGNSIKGITKIIDDIKALRQGKAVDKGKEAEAIIAILPRLAVALNERKKTVADTTEISSLLIRIDSLLDSSRKEGGIRDEEVFDLAELLFEEKYDFLINRSEEVEQNEASIGRLKTELKRANAEVGRLRTKLEVVNNQIGEGSTKDENLKKSISELDERIHAPNPAISQQNGNVLKIEQQIKALEAESKSLSPEGRLLEKAFPGLKFEGNVAKIRGFEAHPIHGFDKDVEKLQGVLDYLSLEGFSGLVNAHTRLQNFSRSNPVDAQLEKYNIDGKGIQELIIKVEEQIRSRDKTIDNVSAKNVNAVTLSKEKRDEIAGEIADLKVVKRSLESIFKQATTLYELMKPLFSHLEIISRAGIKVTDNEGEAINIDNLLHKFGEIELEGRSFKPDELTELYKKFQSIVEDERKIKTLTKDLQKAESEISASTNLSDAKIGRAILKIGMGLTDKDFKTLPPETQEIFARTKVAEGVQMLLTEEGYRAIAQKGSAELLKTVDMIAKSRLTNLKFEVDDKVTQPLEGISPSDFEDPERIEKLANVGSLNCNNCANALAHFELEATKARKDPADVEQVGILRKLLLKLLAKELGVDERMDETGVSKIVNDAFNEQMAGVRPVADEDFNVNMKDTLGNVNELVWKRHKFEELKMRLKALKELRTLGKIEQETFELRTGQLNEEARAYDIADRFAQSTTVAGYWNSPWCQEWIKDTSYGVLKKTKAGVFAAGQLYLSYLWGSIKHYTTAALKGAVHTPISAVKNVGLLAASPLKWSVNAKRRLQNFVRRRRGKEAVNLWTPFSVAKSVKNDAVRAGGYLKEKGTTILKGAKESITSIPKKQWAKEPWKDRDYKGRTKIDVAALEAQADELAKTGGGTPIKLASSPYIDINQYRVRLQELDKMTGVPDVAAA